MSGQQIIGPEPPEEARWALALDGIRRLDQKLTGIIEAQQGQQNQINDLRNAYSRTAPMSTLQLVEQDVRREIASLSGRVTSMESGSMAAILSRLDADAAARTTRQDQTDRSNRWRAALLVLVLLGILLLGALELWTVLR